MYTEITAWVHIKWIFNSLNLFERVEMWPCVHGAIRRILNEENMQNEIHK